MSSTRLPFCCLLSLTAAGCAHPSAPAARVLQPETAADVAPQESTPIAPPVSGLVVGGPQALTLWTPDGAEHRVISPGPALHPLRTGEDSVLALSGNEHGNLQLGAQLVRVSLRDGARTRLAELPPFRCANAGPDEHVFLDVQDPHDFLLDRTGRIACLTLMDRNANMANLLVRVRVELDTGRVQRWLELGEEECKPPADVQVGDAPESAQCEYPVEPNAAGRGQFDIDFDDESGWVVQHGDKPRKLAHLVDYAREQVSPSGRWVVLGGDIAEADYIHRRLLLCDRRDGALYPVLGEPGPWPAPLQAAKSGRRVHVPLGAAADVVGESDVRWVLADARTELLIVDQLVIRPEAPSWAFEGELAH